MADSVRASHLLVKHSGSRRAASWRDPDGSRFIAAKPKATALAELAALRARIVAGEDFGTLAAQYSDCSSASAGGDLGVFKRCAAFFGAAQCAGEKTGVVASCAAFVCVCGR
jgi:NIMA-interacting peptidyl-prolyl cis-trans isomerase 1